MSLEDRPREFRSKESSMPQERQAARRVVVASDALRADQTGEASFAAEPRERACRADAARLPV
jgi:hypothetical protein